MKKDEIRDESQSSVGSIRIRQEEKMNSKGTVISRTKEIEANYTDNQIDKYKVRREKTWVKPPLSRWLLACQRRFSLLVSFQFNPDG